MKKNNKGFTLVELLAVIVILGLLMAIAIPSVTKYITQSRVKTLISTMDSYITAVVTQVNDGEYKFSDSTKVFAIPIECVSLEKGGQSPFGNWMQANENYWAYVLVHYDSENYNYQYGFTFKDDAGYGLYPTLNGLITNSMVKTGYDDLKQPKDGDAIDFVPIDKWEGFDNITADTELVVLEAGSEGEEGDGQNTCTLCQKGDNYDVLEESKNNEKRKLYNIIINTKDEEKIKLYTGKGESNVYFYVDSTTNNVIFGNYCWKIIRTTDTNGIKIIYNGYPSNGSCNNSGSSTQIGTSAYNTNKNSMAYAGYMYNVVYPYKYKSSMPYNTYVSSSFSYNNGTYNLVNMSSNYSWRNTYSRLLYNNHYSCINSTGTCNKLAYIFNAGSNYAYYIELENGKSVDDAMHEMLWDDNVNVYSSTIKNKIDSWYSSNMTRYTTHLEDVVFCANRSLDTYRKGAWVTPGDITANAYLDFYSYNKKDLSCDKVTDRFTVSTSKGNGKLTYPVGLMTSAEAYWWGKNARQTGSQYWTLDPYMYSVYGPSFTSITSNGGTYIDNGDQVYGVRPVVSLKNEMLISGGTGTSSDPYVVQTN